MQANTGSGFITIPPAAEGRIVDGAVPVGCVIAHIVHNKLHTRKILARFSMLSPRGPEPDADGR